MSVTVHDSLRLTFQLAVVIGALASFALLDGSAMQSRAFDALTVLYIPLHLSVVAVVARFYAVIVVALVTVGFGGLALSIPRVRAYVDDNVRPSWSAPP